MKKVLAILLALLMAASLFACGTKSSGTSPAASSAAPASSAAASASSAAPASSPAASAAPSASAASAAPSSAKFPKEAGFFDSSFDYTKFKKFKIGFLCMTAGELWDAFDVAYAHWAKKLNMAYTKLWAPTQYSAEEFISGMQTYIDQKYDGLILEAGTQNYERVAEILKEAKIQWVTGLGVARTNSKDPKQQRLLHPQIGTDNLSAGKQIVTILNQWKEKTYPNVPWDKVGLMNIDYSHSPDIHAKEIGMEMEWAKLHPEFGAYDPAPDKNPKNVFIGDLATAQNPDQTAAQNLVTQVLSKPGNIEVWLIGTTADLYAVGAANAAEALRLTEKTCVVTTGGSSLPARFDSGINDAWRYALYTSNSIYGEPIVNQLWAYLSGQATPDTIYPDWVNVNDKGDVKDASGKVTEEHNMAIMMLPVYAMDKSNYKQYLEWCDLYAYGPNEKGVFNYTPVTDINLFKARGTAPESYKVKQ